MTRLHKSLAHCTAAALLGVATVPAALRAGESSTEALQVLADLTLIDGTCRDVTVNFGVGFRFAEQHGLDVSSIMPTGSRRAEFDRAIQMREASFERDELCGEVSGNYADALPGSVTGLIRRSSAKP